MYFRTNFGRYNEEDDDDAAGVAGGRFRSRFLRGNDDEESGGGNRSSVYEEGDKKKPERIKVVDTEDCSRGPLSGCIRLADSSRVIQRLKVSSCLFTICLPRLCICSGQSWLFPQQKCGKQMFRMCPLQHCIGWQAKSESLRVFSNVSKCQKARVH